GRIRPGSRPDVLRNRHGPSRTQEAAMNGVMIRKLLPPLTLHAETAEELMVPNLISLRAEADVAEATMLFTEKGIAAAPVIDEAGRPIGVISRSDLLIHQAEQAKQRLGADDDGLPRETAGTVADLMTPAVFAVGPDTPV